ncbi:RHS repeat-associated core domain-containing protein [Pleionea sp. CnH1-48]|uniref:golvesin C-terminal-like domain-containing protein n=1 Tax=Pleionea sp. CnH1-48 TaxID=2954494 RepID=UPI002097D2B9|nr:RHS repeat-associated core domain-containing protein [Pleionea sp. CnH1-48]MCO7223205.1 RHS domain-containing protein [Pleionea sp. CnH1-48]
MTKYLLAFLSVVLSLTLHSGELDRWIYEFEGVKYSSLLEAEAALYSSQPSASDYRFVKSELSHNRVNIYRHYERPNREATVAGGKYYGSGRGSQPWGTGSFSSYYAEIDTTPECPDEVNILGGPTKLSWGLGCTHNCPPPTAEHEYANQVWTAELKFNIPDDDNGCRLFIHNESTELFEVTPMTCPDDYYPAAPFPTCKPTGAFPRKTIIAKPNQYCTSTELNPCSPVTGQKIEKKVDYEGAGLPFTRTYFSSNETVSVGLKNQPYIGQGWTHNYMARLKTGSHFISEDGYMFALVSGGRINSGLYKKYGSVPGGYAVWRNDGSYLKFSSSLRNANSELLLSAIVDVSGLETTLEYESLATNYHRLVRVTGPFGHVISLEYDESGRISELINPASESVKYTYELASLNDVYSSRLMKVTYPDQSFTEYHYENEDYPYALTGISESGKRYGIYKYDARGRVIESGRVEGFKKGVLNYREDGSTQVRFSDNSTKVYEFSKGLRGTHDKPSKITQGLKEVELKWETYGRDMPRGFERRRLLEKKDSTGLTTTYEYDSHHVTKVTRAFQSEKLVECNGECVEPPGEECQSECGDDESISRRSLVTETVNEVRTTEYEYLSDSSDLQTKVTSNSVSNNSSHRKEISVVYHASLQKPVSVTITGFTHDGVPVTRSFKYEYNEKGQLVTVNGPRENIEDITTYTYYDCVTGVECGQLKSMTNALGHTTQFELYDAHGRLLRQKAPNGMVTQYEYRRIDDKVSRIITGSEHNTRESVYEYYLNGLMKTITVPGRGSTQLEYNDAKLLKKLSDSLGNSVLFEYDSRGNITNTRLINSSGETSYVNSKEYDEFNRVVKTINGNDIENSFTYDTDGNKTSVTNGLLKTTFSQYDAIGRLSRIIDAENSTLFIESNILEKPSKVSDQEGKVTSYLYDDLGNLLEVNSPATGLTRYTYDEAGNRISKVDAKGVMVSYEYDAINRIKSQAFSDASENILYGYDEAVEGAYNIGRLTSVIDSSGTTRYSYDIFGQVIEENKDIDGMSFSLEYHYNTDGLLTQVTFPSGRVIRYQYNELGKVLRILSEFQGQAKELLREATYLPFGPVTRFYYGNNIGLEQSYDLDYRLTSKKAMGVYSASYTFDATDNIKGIMSDIELNGNQSFAYDSLSRLLTGVGSYGEMSFSYDKIGNRLSKTHDNAVSQYQYKDGSHHLEGVTGSDSVTLMYDEKGNNVSRNQLNFTYNQQGRMSAVSTSEVTTEYRYNFKGERVSKSTNNGVNYYIFDKNGSLIAEANNTGRILREYVHFNSQPLALFTDASGGTSPSETERYVLTDDDDSVSLSGEWKKRNAKRAHQKTHHLSKSESSSATWKLEMPAGRYQVEARWVASKQKATQAPYVVNNADGVDRVLVNQRRHNGQWRTLGTYNFSGGGEESIILSSENGGVSADAIRLTRVYDIDDSDSNTAKQGSWKERNAKTAANGQHYISQGDGVSQFTWTPEIEEGRYEVYARWVASRNKSKEAAYTIRYGNNEQRVFSDQTRNGGKWQLLGEFNFTGNGNETIILSNGNGIVSADSIRLTKIKPQPSNGSTLYYYHNNHLGAPKALTDEAGEVRWKARYSPFGKATLELNTIEQNIRLPGQYFDSESGLHYNYFRDYDPEVGRYIQSDPIGLAGGINTYGYVGGNPINYTDPDGKVRRRLYHLWARFWKEPGRVLRDIERTLFPPPPIPPRDSITNDPLPSELPPGWPNQHSEPTDNVIDGPWSGTDSESDTIAGEECGDEDPERCKKVKDSCIADCSLFALPSRTEGAVSFRRCVRSCMERQGCFNF